MAPFHYFSSFLPLLYILPQVIASPVTTSPLLSFPPTNLSSPFSGPVSNLTSAQIIHYHVPGTVTSLTILTGGPMSSVTMRTSLAACRSNIARAMYRDGGYHPINPDPYVFPNVYSKDPRDTKFTGAGLEVHSTFAWEQGGLTWWQLDHAVKGLQDVMLAQGRYTNVQFTIFDGLTAVEEQAKGWFHAPRKGGGDVA